MGVDHFLNLQAGTLVNERYEIVKCLGAGSMGMVYACRHKELAGHIVAMKVLYSEVAKDEISATRFKNEIFASYNVSHPNVVRAYEYFTDGDLTAFTMEYIGGGDLADKLDRSEQLDFDTIIKMLGQMASGLTAIHEAGIIHRDIKPENILVTSQGDIKITDFGIARKVSGPRLTEHGGVVGTIDYVSPEYLELSQVDERSDIYSLGILAYEMITLQAPFRGKSIIETMQLRLKEDPTPPIELREDCPLELSNVVLKMMARNPEERYQTASDLHDELKSFENLAKAIEQKEKLKAAPFKEKTREDKPTQVYSAERFKGIPESEDASESENTPAKEEQVIKEPVKEDSLENELKESEILKSEDVEEQLQETEKPEDAKEILKTVLQKEKLEEKDQDFSSFKDFANQAKSNFSKDIVSDEMPLRDGVAVTPAIEIARVKHLRPNVKRRLSLKSFAIWIFALFVWAGLFFSVMQHYNPSFFNSG